MAFELPKMAAEQLPALAAVSKAHNMRLMVNSLWEGFIAGYGGDADAVRNPDQVWGRLYRDGVSLIQTDAAEALLRYRATQEPAVDVLIGALPNQAPPCHVVERAPKGS